MSVFLYPINKQSLEHLLKTADRKRQSKVSERKSLNWAIENQRKEEVVNRDLPQEHQDTLVEVNLEPEPSLETEKYPFKDHNRNCFAKIKVSSA